MPSILKRFTRPAATAYEFPPTDSLMEAPAPSPHLSVVDFSSDEGDDTASFGQNSTDPKSPIDFAQVQADAIIADAHKQAEQILRQAKADIAEELEKLRSAALFDGQQQGFAEGMSRAVDEAKAQRARQTVELGAHVQEFLENASKAHEEFLEQSQAELRDLALAVAEKIVRVSLKSSSEVVSRMIQGATEKMKKKEWAHIYIAGVDAKGFAKVNPQLTYALSFLSDHVKIVPMADDESGTCIIETPDEIVDASASTQLSNIRELLSEVIP